MRTAEVEVLAGEFVDLLERFPVSNMQRALGRAPAMLACASEAVFARTVQVGGSTLRGATPPNPVFLLQCGELIALMPDTAVQRRRGSSVARLLTVLLEQPNALDFDQWERLALSFDNELGQLAVEAIDADRVAILHSLEARRQVTSVAVPVRTLHGADLAIEWTLLAHQTLKECV